MFLALIDSLNYFDYTFIAKELHSYRIEFTPLFAD